MTSEKEKTAKKMLLFVLTLIGAWLIIFLATGADTTLVAILNFFGAVAITTFACCCAVCVRRKKETHTIVNQAPTPQGSAEDPDPSQFQPGPRGAQPSAPQAVPHRHLAPQHPIHPGTVPMTQVIVTTDDKSLPSLSCLGRGTVMLRNATGMRTPYHLEDTIDPFQKPASTTVRHCLLTHSEHVLRTRVASAFGVNSAQHVLITSVDVTIRRGPGANHALQAGNGDQTMLFDELLKRIYWPALPPDVLTCIIIFESASCSASQRA
ncbi:hypothetical protein ISCGN_031438 [Ixodes scapularis]